MELWSDAPEMFANQTAVARFVSERFQQRDGKPLSERTVRGHMQGRGKRGKLLYPQPSGGYARSDVQDYVGRQGFVPIGQDGLSEEKEQSAKQLDLEIQEQEAKLRKLIAECKTKEFEFEQKNKEYCRVADLDAEMSARALALRQTMLQELQEHAEDLANIDNGQAVVDLVMDYLDQAMHDYVSTESFHVLMLDR